MYNEGKDWYSLLGREENIIPSAFPTVHGVCSEAVPFTERVLCDLWWEACTRDWDDQGTCVYA